MSKEFNASLISGRLSDPKSYVGVDFSPKKVLNSCRRNQDHHPIEPPLKYTQHRNKTSKFFHYEKPMMEQYCNTEQCPSSLSIGYARDTILYNPKLKAILEDYH